MCISMHRYVHVQYRSKKGSRSVYIQWALNVDAFKKQRNKNTECTARFRLNQQFFDTFFLWKLQNVFTVKKHVPAFIALTCACVEDQAKKNDF